MTLEDIENEAGREIDSYGDMPFMEGRLGLMVLLQKVEEGGVDNFLLGKDSQWNCKGK